MPQNDVRLAKQSLEVYSIGSKLRALREQKRLTLSRLATETGLSTALISKLETGRMIPTLPTLGALCRVYGVGLGFFFTDACKHSISITRNLLEKKRDRKRDALKESWLNVRAPDSRLQAKEIEFPSGVVVTLAQAGRALCSVVCVLEGSLQFDTGGVLEVLETGDCVCLESEMLITWSAIGKANSRALVVTFVES